MLVTRNWLKEYLGEEMPSTEEISNLLMLHAFEIEGVSKVDEDEVIDVDILPNRASDCLSHRGIAREIAVLTKTDLKHDPLRKASELPKTEKISINITDSKACRRFGASLMTGITIKESPDWLKERLEAIGERSVNNVVDATNYVMFSLGQPLHAYDADKFPSTDGVWRFGVRFSKEDEEITVLTGEEYVTDPSVQLIVDDSSDTAVGIAGIKGGKYAEIDKDTKNIILEAANFDPTITRKAAQKLRLQTDASKRFENEPSRDLVPHALREVVALIEKIAGGECDGYVDEYPEPSTNPEVEVSHSRINSLLGLSLTEVEMRDIFDRLGFSVTGNDGNFTVKAPFERSDIKIEEDVVEEIGRVHGYDHVKAVVPDTVSLGEYNKRHFYSEQIRTFLIKEGFSEIITSSFRKKDIIKLRNALASDKGYLRSSLRGNIKEALDRNVLNLELLNIDAVRVFEIGTVFDKSDDGKDVSEHFSLTLGVRAKKQGYTAKDDTALSEVSSKLEGKLGAKFDAESKDGIIELNLSELISALPDTSEYESVESQKEIAYKSYSSYPYISRDFALWVPENVSADDVEQAINDSIPNPLAFAPLISVTIMDEYKKDNRVSYMFRLIFQSMTETLTDVAVAHSMDAITEGLKPKGWEIR